MARTCLHVAALERRGLAVSVVMSRIKIGSIAGLPCHGSICMQAPALDLHFSPDKYLGPLADKDTVTNE
jgi:hypothetical protein